jgi:hypothetical protein
MYVSREQAVALLPEGRGFDTRMCHWNFSLTESSHSNISFVGNTAHQNASRVMLIENTVSISYHAVLRETNECSPAFGPSNDITFLHPINIMCKAELM